MVTLSPNSQMKLPTVILGMALLLLNGVGAYDVNKAILEADATTPMSGRDESADLFFSQLDEEEADKAAANFNRAVVSKDACYTVAAAPKCPPEGGSGVVANAPIALKDGCTFVLESPGYGAGSKYPNGPYTCTWTFTTNGTNARTIELAAKSSNFALAGTRSGTSCAGDSISARSVSSNLVGRQKRALESRAWNYCGPLDEDVELNTRSNTVSITLNVDGSENAAGFRINVRGKAKSGN